MIVTFSSLSIQHMIHFLILVNLIAETQSEKHFVSPFHKRPDKPHPEEMYLCLISSTKYLKTSVTRMWPINYLFFIMFALSNLVLFLHRTFVYPKQLTVYNIIWAPWGSNSMTFVFLTQCFTN